MRAFTLIELLVVIAIIAILAGFGMKVAAGARQRSNMAASISNLRQWWTALSASLADSDGRLPSDGANGGAADISDPDAWFNRLPRYIGEKALKDITAAADAPKPGKKSVWINPAVPTSDGTKYVQPPGSYLFCYAMNDYLSNDTERTMKLTRVENHVATVFMGERGDDQPVLKVDGIKAYFGGGKPESDPENSANFLFCDGHVGTLKRSEFSDPRAVNVTQLDRNFTFIPYANAKP
jgi:prepilin-type N-terminal cleavage/methylation domain-containing protein/prepilin-type processing-associated H-X9-DG protein